MRKLVTITFVTLDGIMQAPGGPGEDDTGGFKSGGWSVNYWDDIMVQVMGETFAKRPELLLGRKTYELFAAYWPFAKDNPGADNLNNAKKMSFREPSTRLIGTTPPSLRAMLSKKSPGSKN